MHPPSKNCPISWKRCAAADGFAAVVDALRTGRSGTVDGAWGSSSALAVAALGADAPATVLVVLAHPGDIGLWRDGSPASRILARDLSDRRR